MFKKIVLTIVLSFMLAVAPAYAGQCDCTVNNGLYDIGIQKAYDGLSDSTLANIMEIQNLKVDISMLKAEVERIRKLLEAEVKFTKFQVPSLDGKTDTTSKIQGMIIGYLYLIKKNPENADAYFKLMLKGMEQLTGVSFKKWEK